MPTLKWYKRQAPKLYEYYKWMLEKDENGFYLIRSLEQIEAKRKELGIPEGDIDLVEGQDYEIIEPKQLPNAKNIT